ncbi:radical SAM protein [Hydrogenophaga sp. PAMC20947]|uniref:radical SAM/SPASM domain-containing protein n=1 Tax=Hydrogenophaga sp. PAMC20947 TaxID=2565558 RepID=UPI00109E1E15|nr:radical SAM protein [Hydrogenophaga sp. PAMC20947]QCB47665.1 SPASM domain-containing protein [Hydrogenophaga sp. PAMC20947]
MQVIHRLYASASAPLYKRFSSTQGEHLLVLQHSRLFDLPREAAIELDSNPPELHRLAGMLGETGSGEAALDLVVEPPPQSLSLNVSSNCNLACSYCYADRGGFGGKQVNRMTPETAIAAVDRLFLDADRAAPVTIGFLGGEPLLNRTLVHSVVAHAARAGGERGFDVRFSITTNGTTLTPSDIDLLQAHRFAVTVSIDGGADVQDAQRPDKRGRGSFNRLAEHIAPLLAAPGRAQVAARMTISGGRFDLSNRLDAVWELGFREAGVAPLRTAADDSNVGESDWPSYLAELIAVSRHELERARNGASIRLTNLAVALKQIHAGASSPYPCGAGGGYFSVAANGRWYACHRAIGDESFALGDSNGMDQKRRRAFLIQRHVHAQAPCNTCWARYLCSGSCHQEARSRTIASCDFIRGWLEFCLAAYCELLADQPAFFTSGRPS